jgi:hypothetical protein
VPPRIRATQGHSVVLPDPVLRPVADAARVPAAVHVTSEEGCARGGALRGAGRAGAAGARWQRRARPLPARPLPAFPPLPPSSPAPGPPPHPRSWAAIQASGELRRMGRTHIHFATAAHHQRANRWATVLLLLDLPAAMAEGLEFFT